MIYLAKRVCCQLAGEDVPWIPMDPPMFMLTPRCMTNMEYRECGLGIPFTNRVINESDYEEFSRTFLMPSFTIPVYVCAPLIFL